MIALVSRDFFPLLSLSSPSPHLPFLVLASLVSIYFFSIYDRIFILHRDREGHFVQPCLQRQKLAIFAICQSLGPCTIAYNPCTQFQKQGSITSALCDKTKILTKTDTFFWDQSFQNQYRKLPWTMHSDPLRLNLRCVPASDWAQNPEWLTHPPVCAKSWFGGEVSAASPNTS